MSFLRFWMAWTTVTLTAADVNPPACSVTLPWRVSRTSYADVSDAVFDTLFQCPLNLNGCGSSLLSCQPSTYIQTCSCASNCRVYRDCCWEVKSEDLVTEPPESSCVEVKLGASTQKLLYMVTGCSQNWVQDEVRDGCENADSFNETFYQIPVTSVNNITYRNGFCAQCNGDILNATFWDPKGDVNAIFTLPDVVTASPQLHLRPCTVDSPNDTCPHQADKSVSRKCKTYFAPVTNKEDPENTVYRNVYCAICNAVDLSSLACSPPLQLSNFTFPARKHATHHRRPNLASIFRPVLRTSKCYAKHGDRCYIRSPRRFYRGEDLQDTNGTNRTTNRHRRRHSTTNDVLGYLTIICISLSICFLFMKIVVFSVYKEARSFSSKCTLCLSVTLLLTQLLFLLVNSFRVPRAVCTYSAMLVHYGFLSTFFWTNILSLDIWRSITAVRLSSTRRKTLAMYCVVAWGIPLVIVAIAATVGWTAPTSTLSPLYGVTGCWIGSVWGQIVYFLAPMALLLLLSLMMYLHTVFYIRMTTGRMEGYDSKDGVHQNYHFHLTLFVRLAFIMGATWAVGFLGVFVNSPATDIIVIVLVGLQGVYLFFAFKDYRYFGATLPNRKSVSSTITANGVTLSTEVRNKINYS